ncbi:MAG: CDP-diacylglycerol--serine O-phosphatidyltransferase [Endomicrobium sp.]|jgi:CDP-diacylglycerol--serine O-phosphatidyltransferase|nr:CDP-diacylglycerol--serine O-phosphatidyltransferase [Endomicrobium sp.]
MKKIIFNVLKKNIYIVPSIFTCGNIICGYLSIIKSFNKEIVKSSLLISMAMLFDFFDGKIARITNTTTKFGIYLDSIGDSISFGIAPSILTYELISKNIGSNFSVLITTIFVLCSTLRLAKYNLSSNVNVINNSFIGLPTTASAGFLISFILSYEFFIKNYNNYNDIVIIVFNLLLVITFILSLLMISNIPYISLKNINSSKPKILQLLLFLIFFLLVLILIIEKKLIFVFTFIIFSTYIISGIIKYFIKSYI